MHADYASSNHFVLFSFLDIHDDEKYRTYKCPYSSRRFNSRSNMIKHIKMNAERIEIDGEHLTAALTAEIMKRPKLGFVAPSSAKNSSKGGESSSGWNCDLSLIYCTKDHDKENYSMRDL